MIFSHAAPTELVLPVAASVQEQAERQSQQLPLPERWTAYVNAVCVQTVLPWLQEEFSTAAHIWQEPSTVESGVNGRAIALPLKRLVLIPSRDLHTPTLVVPQKWVDDPTCAGDYFLAVQVDLMEHWLRIWGYTTHAQIKDQGEFAEGDRTYCLDATQLIPDITALPVLYQLNPQEQTRAALAPLPVPPATAATQEPLAVSPPVNLANWLQQQFEAGWEALNTLLHGQNQLAYSFRGTTDLARAHPVSLSADHSAMLVVLLEPDSGAADPEDGRSPHIQIRLYPGDRPFPTDVTLALLTPTGEVVQQVQATQQAEFIQLKRFRCRPGRSFVVQIATDQPIFTQQFTY